MEKNDIWHYILPFPFENEKRRLIWNVLQSKIGKSLLTNMKLDRRTYQKDLINDTAYSNKSIIEYLKRMVSADILEQGMEKVSTKKRKVNVKWYVPTKLGRWFIIFLKPTEEIQPELARKIIKEIFQIYALSIVELCKNFTIDMITFQEILNKEYNKKE
ncbi:hypothetical protein KJN74_04395 [Candidatus Bathyarchaeota archaeon]|nr:hypothetical protein [Candidatus Bathyarchaeota archaeon]